MVPESDESMITNRANCMTAARTARPCANCDAQFQFGSEFTAFCSLACNSQARLVRAFRLAFAMYGRDSLPTEVEQGLRVKMAQTLAGGYDSTARNLSRAAREAIIERDGGRCVWCNSPSTEIDQVDCDSSDRSNLRLLCHPHLPRRGSPCRTTATVTPEPNRRLTPCSIN